jgi:GNAT superfamily N-acetyltransferase
MDFQIYSPTHPLSIAQKELVADFLVKELEDFGDPKADVSKCLDYAMNTEGSGGLVNLAFEKEELIGAMALNHTGMSGYIPEHILVYFAIRKNRRGEGLGKMMMTQLLAQTRGSIALHVEPNNPAMRLYEEFGFTNKYMEMRLVRD